MKNTKSSNKRFSRITVTMTPEQLDLLSKISTENGYESISAALRVMVTKYGKFELEHKNMYGS